MAEETGEAGAGTRYVPSFPWVRRLDAAWYRAERLACAVLFLAMAALVFAAVVKETFGARKHWYDVAILFGVCLLGVRTRAVKDGETRPGWPVSLAIAAVVTGAIVGVVVLYLRSTPGTMIWAQKLTLVMMIWVALLGASIATYDRSHLALEMGEKLWPKPSLCIVWHLPAGQQPPAAPPRLAPAHSQPLAALPSQSKKPALQLLTTHAPAGQSGVAFGRLHAGAPHAPQCVTS